MPAPSSSARRRLYWLLQVLGWSLYGLTGVFLYASFARYSPEIIGVELCIVVTLIGISHLLRYCIRRLGWLRLSLGALFGRLLLTNAVLALLSQVIIAGLIAFLVRPTEMVNKGSSAAMFAGYVVNTYFVLWMWAALYVGLHYLWSYRQAEIDKWKLAAAVREAEMQTLKAQINPHFLFNGLNNIRALIGEDPERARHMLLHLSELLRYAIQLNRTEQVPLHRELAVVRDYLQLESLQLEERLRYTLDVPDDCLAVQVPPMLVQLLVENAIKHGIAPRPEGGTLRVEARRHGGQLWLTVENTGELLPAAQPRPDGTGTGLRNATERLRLLFGEQAELRLEQTAPETVTAQVKLPLFEELGGRS